MTFDKLKYSKKLIQSGLTIRQAEGHVEALAEIVDNHIATKNDLRELQYKILIKLGSLMIACIGVSTTILGALIALIH